MTRWVLFACWDNFWQVVPVFRIWNVMRIIKHLLHFLEVKSKKSMIYATISVKREGGEEVLERRETIPFFIQRSQDCFLVKVLPKVKFSSHLWPWIFGHPKADWGMLQTGQMRFLFSCTICLGMMEDLGLKKSHLLYISLPHGLVWHQNWAQFSTGWILKML